MKSSKELKELDEAIAQSLLQPDYRPSKKEEFMSGKQLEYFRQKITSLEKRIDS